MTASLVRRIVFVAPKREAQPMLSQLRSSGHEVSLVEDLDEAGAILGIAGFDHAVVPGVSLQLLLEQRLRWDTDDGEAWRRSTAAIVHDLRGLLNALGQVTSSLDGPSQKRRRDRNIDAINDTVDKLSVFAEELMQELVTSEITDSVTAVDLEDATESAAVAVYPSAIERSQRLSIDIDDEVITVKTHPARLKRILKNLLEFAASRAPERGRIAVKAIRDGTECVICVSCDGTEITRSELGRIFSKPPGPTKGTRPLVLAQELIAGLDGRMWVESEMSGGFSVFIGIPHRARYKGTVRSDGSVV